MTTIVKVELMAETCIACGTIFGLLSSYQDTLRETGKTFYCPNGHGMVYGNPLKERIKNLERQLKQEQEVREYWHKSAKAEETDHTLTKRRLSATKGQLTKTKKRIGNGVCPCCHRTFKQLVQHMANKHPEYKEGKE